MEIICIEGAHGAGKTTICKQLERDGFSTLDESFLDMPDYSLSPQSFTMETIWISAWVTRLLNIQKENKSAGKSAGKSVNKYFADRSPFSAVIYAASGSLLEETVRTILKELKAAGITIRTVYLNVSEKALWRRIQNRLKDDPTRIRYNENSRQHMCDVLEKYSKINWDYYIVADGDLSAIADAISII